MTQKMTKMTKIKLEKRRKVLLQICSKKMKKNKKMN